MKWRFLFGTMLGMLGAQAAHANVIWRGDFETGDISQWSSADKVSEDRLKIVNDPVREGKHALEATVHQGDDPINASGNRNELVYTGDSVEGTDRFYAWSTMWPNNYASENTWQVFTQWHHQSGGGSPPVEFYVIGETVYFRVSGVVIWKTPLDRGRWHDFIFHAHWAENGSVELWYDGQQVVTKTPAHTLFPGQGAYLKQGLYRKETIGPVQTIFHDGMIVGTTLADVQQQQALSSSSQNLVEQQDGTMVDANSVKAGCATAGVGAMLPSALVALLVGLGRRRRKPSLAAPGPVR